MPYLRVDDMSGHVRHPLSKAEERTTRAACRLLLCPAPAAVAWLLLHD